MRVTTKSEVGRIVYQFERAEYISGGEIKRQVSEKTVNDHNHAEFQETVSKEKTASNSHQKLRPYNSNGIAIWQYDRISQEKNVSQFHAIIRRDYHQENESSPAVIQEISRKNQESLT